MRIEAFHYLIRPSSKYNDLRTVPDTQQLYVIHIYEYELDVSMCTYVSEIQNQFNKYLRKYEQTPP